MEWGFFKKEEVILRTPKHQIERFPKGESLAKNASLLFQERLCPKTNFLQNLLALQKCCGCDNPEPSPCLFCREDHMAKNGRLFNLKNGSPMSVSNVPLKVFWQPA